MIRAVPIATVIAFALYSSFTLAQSGAESACAVRAEAVKENFLRDWDRASGAEQFVNKALPPLPSCEVVYSDPNVCSCLGVTACTAIARPTTPCSCSDPGPGSAVPANWPSAWSQFDPCGPSVQFTDVSHYAILNDRAVTERFVFQYGDGTVNEVFIVPTPSNRLLTYVAACGDGRAYVELVLRSRAPEPLQVCNSL